MNEIDFRQRADVVAPQLLGATISRGDVSIRLTEVEAYLGLDDPASHAFRGPTKRAAIMFGEPGRIYVYVSYGIHLAVNLICSPAGSASAVLLRGGEVVVGTDVARLRRGLGADHSERLARGPGNLGQALGVSLDDNGAVLGEEPWRLSASDPSVSAASRRGPRVGVSAAADVPLRWWLAGEPTVSAYRRSPRAE